jgi:hypothetical protein
MCQCTSSGHGFTLDAVLLQSQISRTITPNSGDGRSGVFEYSCGRECVTAKRGEVVRLKATAA